MGKYRICWTTGPCVLIGALAIAGCGKKTDGAAPSGSAASTTTTAPAAGIKGTVKGKAFEAKVAMVQLGAAEDGGPILYLKPFDAKCTLADITKVQKGLNELSVLAPMQTGVAKFDDKIFADMTFWQSENQTATSWTPHGEIEWIKIPTASSKGLVRVQISQDPDTKVEGSIEVSLCDPK